MSKLLKNTLSLGASQTLSKIISLVSIPIIARMLGTEGFGVYTLAFSFVFLFTGFSDWGINTLTMKKIARDKNLISQFLSNALLLRFLLGVIFYFLMIITIRIIGYPENVGGLIAILGFIIILNNLMNAFVSTLNALEKMEVQSILNVIVHFLTISTVITSLLLGKELRFIFSLIVFLYILSFLILIIFSKRHFSIRLKRIDLSIIRYILTNSWPYALLGILWVLYLHNGTILLSKIQDITAVGIYTASYKLFTALLFIPFSLLTALFPIMSRQAIEKNPIRLKLSDEKAIYYLILIALPLAVVVSFLAKPIILLLFGQEFIESAGVLAILIWVLFLIFINIPLNISINSSDKVKKYIPWAITIVGINIVLGIILIMKFTFYGAAWALFLTEVIKLGILISFLNRFLKIKINFTPLFPRPIIIGAVLGFSALLLKLLDLNLFLILGLIALGYIAFLIYFKELTLDLVKRVIRLGKY